MSRPLLEVRNLIKTFPPARRGAAPVHAVADVSFALHEGETLALVGESGSGKSTIGQCITHLHRPDAGAILLDGEDVAPLRGRALRQRRQAVQMIFQDPASALNPRMTVGDALREALRLRHPDEGRAAVEQRLTDLLALIGLRSEHGARYPHQLSGGQKQRVGIARALALEPRVLIADEAVSALDVSIQAQIILLLGELRERLGLTLLFISHDLGVVRYIADRVAVLYLGHLVEIAPAAALFSAPMHPYTRALLAAIPDPARPIDATSVLDEPPAATTGVGGCVFAPRCPLAMDACREAQPPLATLGGGRASACLRHAELTAEVL
jgi:oligopeptide/dipeptide ABC transporter, ATP-binding protein, C-terminal domain